MNDWLAKIDAAQTLEELDEIIEQAAFDDSITNKEYEAVYQHAVSITDDWRRF